VVLLTRQTEFCASHFYHRPDFSEEENRRLFGKCANRNGHGHNYVLQVTVRGEPQAETGMVLDLKELKGILEHEVMERFDHRFLNYDVPAFATAIPTTENLAVEIWRRLAPRITQGRLHQVRLFENADLYVDYFGE
jgi:6-pyruvoyltetrahydropterin/6-carboxytetrahydropterin synthase